MDQYADIDELYIKNYESMITYALAVLQNPTLAEDAVHDTFYEAIRQYEKFRNHANKTGWLMVTLKNKIRESLRSTITSQQRYVPLDTHTDCQNQLALDMDTMLIYKEMSIGEIRKALTEEEFFLLSRITLDGENPKNVAKELDIGIMACYKRLERIRKKLRSKFPQYYDR